MDNDLISRGAAIEALLKEAKERHIEDKDGIARFVRSDALTPSAIRRVLRQVPGVEATDTVKRLEDENERRKRAIQEWVDGKCISQKHLLMIGKLQAEVEQLRKERDEAVDDAVYANNLLKLIYHLMRERRVIQED